MPSCPEPWRSWRKSSPRVRRSPSAGPSSCSTSPHRRASRPRWSSRPRPSRPAVTRRTSRTASRRLPRSNRWSSTADRSVIVRLVGAALLVLPLAASAQAWPLSYGGPGANRVVAGKGTFPRLLVISAVGEAPFRWIFPLPPKRLAGIDANGTLWIFELGQTELQVVGRYGEIASPDGPPAAVALGEGRSAVVAVSPEGRLLVFSKILPP